MAELLNSRKNIPIFGPINQAKFKKITFAAIPDLITIRLSNEDK